MVEVLGPEVATDVVIEIDDLRVDYDGVEILHGINCSVQRGEFVSIVGKSGCGKSTLLLALAGFIPSEGRVTRPAEIGMVFQSYAVFPWLTVRGNIAFGVRETDRAERERVIAKHLKLVDLEHHASKYPSQLSGGQTQRVALARAMAPNPSVILMDEPFGALDAFTRDRMQEWLQDVWERDHKTVLFVTHNIEEAIFLSDRIVTMGDGQVLDDLPVRLRRPRPPEVKFDHEFVELKRQIVQRMLEG